MFFSAFLVFESMVFSKNRPERNRFLTVTQEELASMPTETPVPESVRARNILDGVPAYLANTLTQGSWPSPLKLEQQTSKSNNSSCSLAEGRHGIHQKVTAIVGIKSYVTNYSFWYTTFNNVHFRR